MIYLQLCLFATIQRITYFIDHKLFSHAVDPGYYECGPVQVQDSNMYELLSEVKEDEPTAYEVRMPVSSSKNKKEEWAEDSNPVKMNHFELID